MWVSIKYTWKYLFSPFVQGNFKILTQNKFLKGITKADPRLIFTILFITSIKIEVWSGTMKFVSRDYAIRSFKLHICKVKGFPWRSCTPVEQLFHKTQFNYPHLSAHFHTYGTYTALKALLLQTFTTLPLFIFNFCLFVIILKLSKKIVYRWLGGHLPASNTTHHSSHGYQRYVVTRASPCTRQETLPPTSRKDHWDRNDASAEWVTSTRRLRTWVSQKQSVYQLIFFLSAYCTIFVLLVHKFMD